MIDTAELTEMIRGPSPVHHCAGCGRPIRYAPIADEWWHPATGSRWCARWALDPYSPQRARPDDEWMRAVYDDPARHDTMTAESGAMSLLDFAARRYPRMTVEDVRTEFADRIEWWDEHGVTIRPEWLASEYQAAIWRRIFRASDAARRFP